jgi:hypothetical protein
MKTALKRYGFDDTDPLTTWLNWAGQTLCDEYDWRWLEYEATVNGIAGSTLVFELTPQSMIQRINWFKTAYDYGDGPPLEFLSSTRFHEMKARNPLLQGTPVYYTAWPADEHFQVSVYPAPSTEMVFHYQIQTKEEENGLIDAAPTATFNLIPPELHRAVVIRAAVFGLEAENEEDRASKLEGTYNTLVMKAINRQPKYIGPLFVQDTQGYGN